MLAEVCQQKLKRGSNHEINAEKEDRGHKGQHEDHRRGHKNLAAGGPDNLRHFRTGLLQELKWIGHVAVTSLYGLAYTHGRGRMQGGLNR